MSSDPMSAAAQPKASDTWSAGAELSSMTDHHGTALVTVTVRRAYSFAGSRLALVDAVPQPSWERDVVAEADRFAPVRPGTDIVVRGSAFASRPTVAMEAGVAVGPKRRAVRVIGKRTLDGSAGGGFRFSAPASFVELPLSWRNAYGGEDADASDDDDRDDYASYLRNPHGVGFLGRGSLERLVGSELPTQEAPEDALSPDRMLPGRPWITGPLPGGLGPIDWGMFPRLANWIPLGLAAPDVSALAEVRMGALTGSRAAATGLGFSFDAYSCAAPGLGGAQLVGTEPFELWGMHRARPTMRAALPAERPEAKLSLPGCTARVLPATLKTLLIEPAEERLFVTWCAALAVLVPFDASALRDATVSITWRHAA